jgi:hypothetical protein
VAGYDFDRFAKDDKTRDAVVWNLQTIGEAAQHLPPHLKSTEPAIPWKIFVAHATCSRTTTIRSTKRLCGGSSLAGLMRVPASALAVGRARQRCRRGFHVVGDPNRGQNRSPDWNPEVSLSRLIQGSDTDPMPASQLVEKPHLTSDTLYVRLRLGQGAASAQRGKAAAILSMATWPKLHALGGRTGRVADQASAPRPAKVYLAHGRCPDRRVDGRSEMGIGRNRADDEVRLSFETAMIHCPWGRDGEFSGPRGGSPDRAAARAAAPDGRPQVIDIPRGIASPVPPRQAVAAADAMFQGGCDGTKPAGDGTNRRAPGTKVPAIGTKIVPSGTCLERTFCRPDVHSRASPVGCTSIGEARTRARISCPALPE